MSFLKATDSNLAEVNPRRKHRNKLLTFGIEYLDDAMIGIMPNDLILIGAGSGAGKTQICCNIAAANITAGKRVHYIALEAELYEIERRIKYQLFSKYYFRDGPEKRPPGRINFQNWMMGDYFDSHFVYEALAADEFEKTYSNFFIYYKQDKFDIYNLIETVTVCAKDTDLIIVDHVHYFDYDDDNENKSIKEIAKAARMLTLEQGKPLILVSHIRKRDKKIEETCPGLEEFHGSSDLYKIATKAITIGPGASIEGGKYETFIRIVKNRFDGGVTRHMGKVIYDNTKGQYEKVYEIGSANQKRADGFTTTDKHNYPDWGRHFPRESSYDNNVDKGKQQINYAPTMSPNTRSVQ